MYLMVGLVLWSMVECYQVGDELCTVDSLLPPLTVGGPPTHFI